MKPNVKPWITKSIIKEIYQRDYLKEQAKKLKTEEADSSYKLQRNKVTSLIRNSKRSYFEELINDENESIWEILKQVYPVRQASNPKSTISCNDFAKHFSQTGQLISDSFTSSVDDNKTTTIKGPDSIHIFDLKEVNTKDVTTNKSHRR